MAKFRRNFSICVSQKREKNINGDLHHFKKSWDGKKYREALKEIPRKISKAFPSREKKNYINRMQKLYSQNRSRRVAFVIRMLQWSKRGDDSTKNSFSPFETTTYRCESHVVITRASEEKGRQNVIAQKVTRVRYCNEMFLSCHFFLHPHWIYRLWDLFRNDFLPDSHPKLKKFLALLLLPPSTIKFYQMKLFSLDSASNDVSSICHVWLRD